MPRGVWSPKAMWRHDAPWRPPADPALILIERREPAPVNALGRGPSRTYDQLDAREKRRYDSQRRAYLAACDLITACNEAAGYGLPVPSGKVRAWTTARRSWVGVRTHHYNRATPERKAS